ncbi:protein kinase [uncultured Metabacillus sp.]|uniref:serine/threonine protein kinase n=1 Tax=uncultured Metabacillus sp. TaxID=2860135 RepID=UPI0026388348|nr:protein kinase [uncultured Metabacillus sp.]
MKKIYSKLIELCETPFKAADRIGGKYTIIDMLGKGSYGFTYLVKDDLGSTYVLKQLRRYKTLEAAGREAFRREANILMNLNHSAFPAFSEQFEENQKQFIVMEYKKGKTFEELIFQENRFYSESAALKELYEILKLVKYIHENGYVHRDLRIPNILKNEEEYYIIDFGLARKIDEKTNDNKENLNHLEKRLFREVAFKSDFYALGHFLLFLLYSSYVPTSKKQQSWEEELQISYSTKKILRKMLQLDEPYQDISSLLKDVTPCI